LRLLDRGHQVENGVVVAALLAAAALPIVDAIARPFGHFHVPGGAEYLRHLTLWLAFAGGLVTTRERKHLSFSTGELLGEGRLAEVARGLTSTLAAATTAVLAYASVALVRADREVGKELPGGLPEWVSECIMPLALTLMALRFVGQASPGWRGRALALLAVAAIFALGLVPETTAAWAPALAGFILGVSLLGAPVFVILGSLALLLFFKDGTPVAAVSAEVYRLISSPVLPALPLLTAAGYVLAESQASTRLLRFFHAWFGWLPGGLAIVVACLCALFTTFTGGSGVTVVALGGLLLPMLRKDGYPEGFAIGLVTASASLGLLFPPSLPVILYSVVVGSREAVVPPDLLYLAGLVPGLLMLGLLGAYGAFVGARSAQMRTGYSLSEAWRASFAAKWELGLPILVIVLFTTGRVSTVEAAAGALLYAIVAECLITRDVSLRKGLPTALRKSTVLSGALLILLSAAMGTTSYIVDAQVPERVLAWVRVHLHSPEAFLLAVNLLMLVIGALLDEFSSVVLLAPLLAPMGLAFGVEPVHLGVVFLANLGLGYILPPVGLNLFLAASLFEKPLAKVARYTLPFVVILFAGVLLITYVPALSLGVLRLLGKGAPAGP
jgi:tripartite ATP-independent transporter DctM subunit